jgi:hypothetical protein
LPVADSEISMEPTAASDKVISPSETDVFNLPITTQSNTMTTTDMAVILAMFITDFHVDNSP